jgi:hypothetical protein
MYARVTTLEIDTLRVDMHEAVALFHERVLRATRLRRAPRACTGGGAALPMSGRTETYAVNLYWLPLGAGGHSVRLNGRVYEALVALWQRRTRLALYHSALEVSTPAGEYVIEMAPVPDGAGASRGVVAEGPVGSRLVQRLRLCRYEVRRWRHGVIPDIAEAVASPKRVSDDPHIAARVLELVPEVPRLVWGRDELRVHDMWNSNSVISWLLACSGVVVEGVHPPEGGRAPGWEAGLALARRQQAGATPVRPAAPGRARSARARRGRRGGASA